MKKSGLVLSLVFFMSLALVSANQCDLEVSLLSQDPYPSVPGDYVKLVFQVDGLENPECGDLRFELLEDYPIKFRSGEDGLREFSRVTFLKDYDSTILIPYEVIVNSEALDGATPIEVKFSEKGGSERLEQFDLEIENVKADFEVYVKEYSPTTKEFVLEILNIEDSDTEALTVEIPKQENIEVKGASRVIVGDLDSNEYTTADFEATPKDGEIMIKLHYTDSINERRSIEKIVEFDSSYFTGRSGESEGPSTFTYLLILLVVGGIAYYFYKKRKEKHHAHHKHKVHHQKH